MAGGWWDTSVVCEHALQVCLVPILLKAPIHPSTHTPGHPRTRQGKVQRVGQQVAPLSIVRHPLLQP